MLPNGIIEYRGDNYSKEVENCSDLVDDQIEETVNSRDHQWERNRATAGQRVDL